VTDIADPPVQCDECGFVYELGAANDAGGAIFDAAATIAGIVSSSVDVDRRPDAETWSILEYGCHARDVLLVQRERVLLALRVEEPRLEPMGRDERVESDGYRDQRAVDVARQLGDAALMFRGVLARLDEASWQRTLIYNHPLPGVRTIAWVAVHTLHEMVHHLADIRRIAQSKG
jgi:DinB superfamily